MNNRVLFWCFASVSCFDHSSTTLLAPNCNYPYIFKLVYRLKCITSIGQQKAWNHSEDNHKALTYNNWKGREMNLFKYNDHLILSCYWNMYSI